MSLVVDASVGLKWVLAEPDSHLAEALVRLQSDLLIPDFWLHEATKVLWLQVQKRLLTAEEAVEGLSLLRDLLKPTPTGHLHLHDVALELGLAANHPTCDTLYVAFAVAMGAEAVIVADLDFVRAMQTHPDPDIAGMVLPLQTWADQRGAAI